jgi:hypothetical protein
MKSQQTGFNCVLAVGIAALLIAAAKTGFDYRNAWVADAHAAARTEMYLAAHSEPFCAFEGVWNDWERDETITLGCLEVRGNIRHGSYSSTTGPRATSNFSISGIYDIASDSSMQVVGKDRDRKVVKLTKLITVEDEEYPTQMIVIDKMGEKGFYVWQRKSPE